jgi:hypothetical protein
MEWVVGSEMHASGSQAEDTVEKTLKNPLKQTPLLVGYGENEDVVV